MLAAARPDTRDAAVEHAEVRTLLYEEGLIEDPEVQARMSAVVVRMRRDGLAPERARRGTARDGSA